MSSTGATPKPRKSRRNPRACDSCSRRSVKCERSGNDPSQCQQCADYGEKCTFDRPVRKRGAKPKAQYRQSQRLQDSSASPQSPNQDITPELSGTLRSNPLDRSCLLEDTSEDSHSRWQPRMIASQALIMDLTEVFFEVVYPVFPLFHRPTLIRRVSRGEHLVDRPFFSSIMAMCALASARVRDGALYSRAWSPEKLQNPTSEAFFEAADQALPRDDRFSHNFDQIRACVLLAITSIQYGKAVQINFYLGIYHALSAVGGLHDEVNWPQSLGIVELEERRRLFWSTYQLDVFTSIIWDRVIISREASANVSYPTEVDDEMFSNAGFSESAADGRVPWLKGWNFITDLYRIVEHAVDHLRRVRTSVHRTPAIRNVFRDSMPTQSALLEQVMAMYSALPAPLKTTRPITCNLIDDLSSFQAANIAATVQLVRMVHFTNDRSDLEQKCQVASEVIGGFAAVPVQYLRAISSPLLHHLASIGTMLGAAFEEGLSESSYRRIRSVMLDLANLLANLEVDMFCPSGTSDKLRTQVARIDDYMNKQRQWAMAQMPPPVSNTPRSSGSAANSVASASPGSRAFGQQPPVNMLRPGMIDEDSPQFHFPPELFEDWSWAFNFNFSNDGRGIS